MKLLLLFWLTIAAGMWLATTVPSTAAIREDTVIRAEGNPYLIDFQSLQPKRADLRVDVVRLGLDAAFTRWLKREKPYAYRQFGYSKEGKKHEKCGCGGCSKGTSD